MNLFFHSVLYSQIFILFTIVDVIFFLHFHKPFVFFEDLWSVLLKDLYLINKGGGLVVMNTLLYTSVPFAVCELSAYSFWPSTFFSLYRKIYLNTFQPMGHAYLEIRVYQYMLFILHDWSPRACGCVFFFFFFQFLCWKPQKAFKLEL